MAAAEQDFGGKGHAGADKAAAASQPVFVLPPLLAPSAGAMAAATVMGLGLANQMAGAWLGMMKGAMETTRQMAEALGASQHDLESVAGTDTVAEPKRESATILPLARKEKPAVKAEAAEAKRPKVAAPKPATPKPAARKVKAKAAATVDLADLKLLPGVGPKLEQMLKARGLSTLSDVAALKKAEADKLDKTLGLDGRIERDGWVAKAAALIG